MRQHVTPPIDGKPPTALEMVRNATAERHRALEREVGPELSDRSFELETYARFLLAHHRLHAVTAELVDAADDFELLDWPACIRIPALNHDLASLGWSHAEQPAPQPTTDGEVHGATIGLSDPAGRPVNAIRAGHLSGLLYVVEGSCLGNRQILRTLRDQEAFQALGVHAYLSTSVATSGERWKATVRAVESAGEDDIEGVLAGALAGFSCFARFWHEARSAVAPVTSSAG
jgi:heme oxygenase